MFLKVLAVVLVVLLLVNMIYVGMGRISDFIFWLNLGALGLISFVFFGDKTFLKNMFKK
jgi:hypothetical protein